MSGSGLLPLPWWGYLLVALTFTHLTIISVTLYLHRYQAHRAVELHPAVAHACRLWLWLSTGMQTKEWVAVHRKHHRFVEQQGDPHSPKVFGIKTVMLEGAELYRDGADDSRVVERYGHGTPDDWVERCVYGLWGGTLGIALMLVTDVLFFGAIGITIWAVQMVWIPVFAAGIINGAGHCYGYRNFETEDTSTNLAPLAAFIGGEELHNNHHAFPNSAKFSVRRWEFDLGWAYLRLLSLCGLARILTKNQRPRQVEIASAEVADKWDFDALSGVLTHRLHVMSDYARDVARRVYHEELADAASEVRRHLLPAKSLIMRAEIRMTDRRRSQLNCALDASQALARVYDFRVRLQAIFEQRNASPERLLAALQEWCEQAEATGVQALAEFADSLSGYRAATMPT
ncbi:MAG: fatty acid desaturase [Pseudomonadota bacterium]